MIVFISITPSSDRILWVFSLWSGRLCQPEEGMEESAWSWFSGALCSGMGMEQWQSRVRRRGQVLQQEWVERRASPGRG